MSYAVMGYRVKLEILSKQIALPKSERLLVRHKAMRTFTGARLNGKDFSIGLSNLLIGPPYAADYTTEASYLGYALESLCDAFGKSLFNNPVSPFKGSFLEHIDEHLKAQGLSFVSDLIYRGAPIQLPRSSDFPSIGYLSFDEVLALVEALPGKDVSAATDPLSKLDVYLQPQVIEAAQMFCDWLKEAHQHNQGLVAFHY